MRRSLPQLCLDHPIGTLALLTAVVVAGVVSFVQLPIALMPDIVYPMVRVQVTAAQTPPEVLVNTVTRVLEQELAQVEGLEQIESTTEQGRVQITLSMAQGRDMDAALRDAAAWVDRARGSLPADIDPPVIFKFDPQNLPVLEFVLSSDTVDSMALRQLADTDLAYRFVGTAGVATVRVAGGRQRELQVRVDPAKLRSHGLTFDELATALRSYNVQASPGRIDSAGKELFGEVLSLFGSAREIADLQVPAPNGDLVRVRDVADVADGHAEQRLIVTVNGIEGVKLSVFKAPQANSVETAAGVRTRLEELRRDGVIPADVSVAVTADESVYITQSIENARHAMYLAVALVALVVLLFLGDWRYTIVSMLVVPAAVLTALLVMRALGLTLNLMSIGGLIVGVGLLVDYGIVLLENITRHWDTTRNVRRAVETASREVTTPLVAALGVLVAAVAPFLFVGGFAMLFFEEFILTIIFAALAGLVMAFALIPPMFPLLAHSGGSAHAAEGRLMRVLTGGYSYLLNGGIRYRHWVVAGALISLIVAAVTMTRLGYVFLPEIDNGQMTVTVEGEAGMPLDEFDARARQIAALATDDPDVVLVDAAIGGRIGQTIQVTPATAEMLVQLTPKGARDASVQEWIGAFARKVGGLDTPGVRARVSKARIRAIRTFAGSAATQNFDVVVGVQGQEASVLADVGEQVRQRLGGVAGLTDLDTSLVLDQPIVSFSIDRARAASFGVTPAEISRALATAVNGDVPSRFLDQGLYYDIRLAVAPTAVHQRLMGLADLPVARLPNGGTLLLGQVADTRIVTGPLGIDRMNRTAVNSVTATVRGRTLGETAAEVRAALADLSLPSGYHLSYGGRMATLSGGSTGLGWAAAIGVLLIVVVLAIQYEALLAPALIVGVLPVSIVGAVGALYVSGTPLSATAFIGLILLIGIAANNAIVLVAFIEQLRRAGHSVVEAVRLGALLRLRPKLMTACVAMAALVPLASGRQEGGEILQPLAIVVLGGMPVALVATLIVLPALYVIVYGADSGSQIIGEARDDENRLCVPQEEVVR
ncbi:MAG: efflux RND transporter permease subunit [Acidobacteria bacterium]|nr:efflux RND transporter permease subunit [Acidobacteriota bacterium]